MKYTPDHEWLRVEADGLCTVGITRHAQDALGDLVYIELPEIGRHFARSEEACVIESVKAAGDVKMPVAGTVVAVNATLVDAPEKVNAEAEGEGWFRTLKPDDPADAETLLDETAYLALLEQ